MMSVVDWLASLSLGPLAFVLTFGMAGFALLGLWLVERWVMPRLNLGYDDAYYAAALVQSAMLLYGLIAALTAVGVWQRYSDVSGIVSAEATAIAGLWRDLGGYPEGTRDATRAILKDYTEQVMEVAWPKQRDGIVPHEGVDWMDRLQTEIFAFEPVTASQEIIHAEVVDSFNELVQERRQRLDSVQGGLPSVLWWVLLPGAFICLGLCTLFHVHNLWFKGVLLTGLSVFMAMVLFVIVSLDKPYAGPHGVTADSYRLVYEHYMQRG
jgi:hypothetical protein